MKPALSRLAALAAGTILSCPALAEGISPILQLGAGVDSEQAGGSLGAFLPYRLESGAVLFFDVQGAGGDEFSEAFSLGVGIRNTLSSGAVLGVYGYFDSMKSDYDNRFDQLSFGAELLADRYEARANVYLPMDDEAPVDGLSTLTLENDQLVMRQGLETARKGFDAEAGMLFGQGSTRFGAYAGTYWYESVGDQDDTLGGYIRAEVVLSDLGGLPQGSSLRVGAFAGYDDEQDTTAGLTARLRIPFGKAGTAVDNRMLRPVERNRLIRTYAGATGQAESTVTVADGTAIGNVVTLSQATGDAAALNAAVTAGGVGALVLADGTIALDNSLQLLANQTLLGGGVSFAVRGASSGTVMTFTTPGAATLLQGTNEAVPVLALANGTTVSTLAITGGSSGIEGNGVSNVTIDNVDVSQAARDGIRLYDVAGASILNSRIHDLYMCESSTLCEFSVFNPNVAPYAGVSALGTSGLSISNTTMDGVTYGIFAGSEIDEDAYEIAKLASNIDIENVTITNSRREGLLLVAAQDVSVKNLTIDNSALGRSMDLVVLQGTSGVTMDGVNLKGGVNGLMLITSSNLPEDAATTDVWIDNLTISGTSRAGIFFNPVSDIHFGNVTITDAGTDGLSLYGEEWGGGPVKDISFGNLTITNAAQSGIYFMGPVENIAGNVNVSGSAPACANMGWGSFGMGSLTQSDGSVLNLNGQAVDGGNFDARCPIVEPEF